MWFVLGKDRWFAANLSWTIPGLGQFYAGARGVGLGLLLLEVATWSGYVAWILISAWTPPERWAGWVPWIFAGVFALILVDSFLILRHENVVGRMATVGLIVLVCGVLERTWVMELLRCHAENRSFATHRRSYGIGKSWRPFAIGTAGRRFPTM